MVHKSTAEEAAYSSAVSNVIMSGSLAICAQWWKLWETQVNIVCWNSAVFTEYASYTLVRFRSAAQMQFTVSNYRNPSSFQTQIRNIMICGS